MSTKPYLHQAAQFGLQMILCRSDSVPYSFIDQPSQLLPGFHTSIVPPIISFSPNKINSSLQNQSQKNEGETIKRINHKITFCSVTSQFGSGSEPERLPTTRNQSV